jgi:hypothetical protein
MPSRISLPQKADRPERLSQHELGGQLDETPGS